MNKYAGTKTEKNLWEAFAGESQARNKYTYFASVAKKQGFEQISALFLKTADNEKEHAKMWFKELGGLGNTADNLLHAAEGDGVIMNRLMDIARMKLTSDQSLAQDAAEIGKGIYSMCQTIFNFPTALIPCITAAIIPAITANLTKKDYTGVREVQHSSLRVMALIAAPCAMGMLVLSEPIMALLGGYDGDKLGIAAVLLAILAPTIIVNSVTTMTTAIMQAHNHMVIPVINTLIGGLLSSGLLSLRRRRQRC